jgi:hypothetical protein
MILIKRHPRHRRRRFEIGKLYLPHPRQRQQDNRRF